MNSIAHICLQKDELKEVNVFKLVAKVVPVYELRDNFIFSLSGLLSTLIVVKGFDKHNLM